MQTQFHLIAIACCLGAMTVAGCASQTGGRPSTHDEPIITVKVHGPDSSALSEPPQSKGGLKMFNDNEWTQYSMKLIATSNAPENSKVGLRIAMVLSVPADCRIFKVIRIAKQSLGPASIVTFAEGNKDIVSKKYSEVWHVELCNRRQKWLLADNDGEPVVARLPDSREK